MGSEWLRREAVAVGGLDGHGLATGVARRTDPLGAGVALPIDRNHGDWRIDRDIQDSRGRKNKAATSANTNTGRTMVIIG